MKANRQALAADIAFMVLLLLVFVGVMFITVSSTDATANVVSLCVAFAFMMVAHFTNLIVGLILNAVGIFTYASYLIYNLLANGVPIGVQAYFWCILSPLLTAATAVLFHNTHSIEEANVNLRHQVQELATIDEPTGLKNRQAFVQDLDIYRHLANRYDAVLLLVVWKFRFASDIKRLIGAKKLEDAVTAISHKMQDAFRGEDVLYLLDRDPHLWGMLMLVRPDSERLIVERLHQRIDAIDFDEALGERAPKLEVSIGTEYDAQPSEAAQMFLDKAIAQMQYDV